MYNSVSDMLERLKLQSLEHSRSTSSIILLFTTINSIGGGNREARGTWPPLNFRTLHRNVTFAIENHCSLAKWPPSLLVAFSASDK